MLRLIWAEQGVAPPNLHSEGPPKIAASRQLRNTTLPESIVTGDSDDLVLPRQRLRDFRWNLNPPKLYAPWGLVYS
jgi:hypothetical protein